MHKETACFHFNRYFYIQFLWGGGRESVVVVACRLGAGFSKNFDWISYTGEGFLSSRRASRKLNVKNALKIVLVSRIASLNPFSLAIVILGVKIFSAHERDYSIMKNTSK